MSKHYVIACSSLNYLDTFKTLAPSIDTPIGNILIHASPSSRFIKNRFVKNYDHCLTHSHADTVEFAFDQPANLITKGDTTTLVRYSKLAQCEILSRYVGQSHRYVCIDSYDAADLHRRGELAGHTSLLYKSCWGARGIGQAILGSNDDWPIQRTVHLFNTLRDKLRVPVEDGKTVEEQWLEGIGDAPITIVMGNEISDGESVNALSSQTGMYQRRIGSIVAEYRILVNVYGDVRWVQKRQRVKIDGSDGYAQTAASDPCINLIDFELDLEGISHNGVNWGKDFSAFIEAYKPSKLFSMCSIDVFVTADNKWGVFEFQPQYSYLDVDIDLVHAMHVECLTHLITGA